MVAVLSARGKTTDELVAMAYEVSAAPAPARDGHAALDRRAHLLRARRDGDQRPRPRGDLAHGLAGRHRHRHLAHEGAHPRREGRPHPRRRSTTARSCSWPASRACRSDSLDVTTLGRGGSDTTAVALAAALGADVCEIYTDVAGVFSADPRIVPTPASCRSLSFEEMLEMSASRRRRAAAALGRVRAQPRRHDPLPIELRRRTRYLGPGRGADHGTTARNRRDPLDRGGAHHAHRAARTCPGIAGRVLTALADANINVDMIIQNEPESEGHRADMSFTVPRDDLAAARDALEPLKRGARHRRGRQRRPHGEGVGRRRRNEEPSRRRGQDVHRARRGRGEHRDDLHLADQDLLRRARGARGEGGRASCTPRSSSAPTRCCPRTWRASTARRWPSDARRGRGRHRRRGLDDARGAARALVPGRRGRAVRLRALGRPHDRLGRRHAHRRRRSTTSRSRASTSRCSRPARA